MIFKKIINKIRAIKKIIFTWIYNYNEYVYLKTLFKSVKREEFLDKKIVFNTVKINRSYIDREFYLGKILALNGAKVIMLLDDGLLKHHETNIKTIKKKYRYPIQFIINRIIIKKALETYADKNLEIIYYSQFLTDVNYEDWHELKHFAHSSTVRYFQTSELNYIAKKVKDYYILSLKNSILSRCVGEFVLNKIIPDFFVTSHGIYSTWGPAYEFLKKHGIKSLICARSHSHSKDPQDIYFTYAKAQTLTRCQFWQDYKNTPITEEMRKKVEELFNSRISHKTTDTKLYYDGKLDLFKVTKNDGYKYHLAIFPSLIWDGDILDRHIAFNGILDWLISTIDFLKNRKDLKIFLKFHPAEVTTFKNSAKIQDLILEYLNSNKIENLVLIPTQKKIDVYKFLKSGIDFGICYDGVLALEMPFLKIPVLLGGVRGRFSIEGGNYTINKREEYFKYLKNIDEIIEDFHSNYDSYHESIIRYTYWYIFENVIKIPTILKTDRTKQDLFQVRKSNLKLSRNLIQIFK